MLKNSKLQFTLPWGKVYSTRFSTMNFKGNPDLYVDALLEANHNNLADVLLFVDRQVLPAVAGQFFTQVRSIVLNRLAGKKRKDRKPVEVAAQ